MPSGHHTCPVRILANWPSLAREESFAFSSQGLHRMLSPSCLLEEEGKGENRVGQGFPTTDLKENQTPGFLEKVGVSTVPPAGRLPWNKDQWNGRQGVLGVHSMRTFCASLNSLTSSSGNNWDHSHFTEEVRWGPATQARSYIPYAPGVRKQTQAVCLSCECGTTLFLRQSLLPVNTGLDTWN